MRRYTIYVTLVYFHDFYQTNTNDLLFLYQTFFFCKCLVWNRLSRCDYVLLIWTIDDKTIPKILHSYFHHRIKRIKPRESIRMNSCWINAAVINADLFADIAVVDMSDVFRQPSLFYHLGVRESFDMANNVILYHDTDPDTAQSLKVSRSNLIWPAHLWPLKCSRLLYLCKSASDDYLVHF